MLEILLFSKTACEAADDTLVELVDLCYRKFLRLNNKYEKMTEEERRKCPDPKALLD